MTKAFPSCLGCTRQTHPQLSQAFSADPEPLKKQIPLTVLLLTLWSGLGECDLSSQQPGGCVAGADAGLLTSSLAEL